MALVYEEESSSRLKLKGLHFYLIILLGAAAKKGTDLKNKSVPDNNSK